MIAASRSEFRLRARAGVLPAAVLLPAIRFPPPLARGTDRTAAIWSWRGTCGRRRRIFAVPSSGPGSRRSQSPAQAQAVNARAAAARRASVARAWPTPYWAASQRRKTVMSSPSGAVIPLRAACSRRDRTSPV
jgi:hypothetical protein